ncbi:hypothetical protein [Streptomyces sp. NPDC057496]|uniref:hypothetical protein n=1 Tax=Streptomyces sp. NPDC057496 TaxID=3346149 RepID=UPI003679717B
MTGEVAERTERARPAFLLRTLEECRSVIARKVGVYAEYLARGEADGLWDPTA